MRWIYFGLSCGLHRSVELKSENYSEEVFKLPTLSKSCLPVNLNYATRFYFGGKFTSRKTTTTIVTKKSPIYLYISHQTTSVVQREGVISYSNPQRSFLLGVSQGTLKQCARFLRQSVNQSMPPLKLLRPPIPRVLCNDHRHGLSVFLYVNPLSICHNDVQCVVWPGERK